MMFREVELRDRFALAAGAGFRAAEIHAPYDEATQDEVAAWARDAGVAVVLLNVMPATAALPGREADFRDALGRALDYAEAAECRQLHCVAGATDDPRAEDTFVDNLRWAAEQAGPRGVRLLIEPLNTRDNPGYFLTGTTQARRIIDRVAGGVFLQFDVYHMQIMEGFLAETIKANRDLIRHFQIGGVPGRHEPDESQEVNYRFILELIDQIGFEGWVGCEYHPRAGTIDGLGWARPYGIGAAGGA